MRPSLPAVSSAWRTTTTPQLACAARRGWNSDRSRFPSASSATPSFFFLTPALNDGSKSFANVTLEPGLTRNGSMKSASRLRRSFSSVAAPAIGPQPWRAGLVAHHPDRMRRAWAAVAHWLDAARSGPMTSEPHAGAARRASYDEHATPDSDAERPDRRAGRGTIVRLVLGFAAMVLVAWGAGEAWLSLIGSG